MSVLLCAAASAQPAAELDFITGLSSFPDARRMLPEYLKAKAAERLAARRANIDAIRDLDGLRKRQQYVREHIIATLGGFPDRTPLNPRVTGTLERDGYRIEKTILETQPGFFVTANLYVPTRGAAPYPAVLFPLGHEDGAKAHDAWQRIIVTLARRGYVVLTWDPLGQGERVQYFDPDWQDSKLQYSVIEHTELGVQCLLAGDHIARYTVWDGLRALDYLLSRKEVDPKRIACTGNSGGGTHTSYISALDDRISVAAPSCYITSWRRMLASIGPQDAEQVFPNWLRDGFDYPDFVYSFGPKPFRILSAIRDFFPILGARETYAELQSVYARLGIADRISMFDADDGHGYTAPRRAAAYDFLGRSLKQQSDLEPEAPVQLETAADLNCTATGQVATELRSETVFTLNRKRVEALRPDRATSNLPRAVERARALTAFAPVAGVPSTGKFGVIARDGFKIEKLTYESEPGITVPALVYVPEGGPARKPAMLLIDGAGKSASVAAAAHFVKAGAVVLSIDARGLGETRPALDRHDEFAHYFGDYNDGMTALMVGKTLAGMRAEDIVRGLDLLAARADVDPARIAAYGKGPGAVPLLYAAAFDRRLRAVALEGMLVSYEAVTSHPIHVNVFEDVVPGALREFDLPDLAASLAPRPVWLINTVNPLGNRVPAADVRRAYTPATHVIETRPGESFDPIYDQLLRF